ncbi:MAG TPA: HAD-IIIC family phosphatase, partial [Chthoniobacterales bacterium]|nr:HAD-IIIC family phosphatase [Chthoniobacterales bacterium]
AGSEACVLMEWSDLDPRLGIRCLGTWRPTDIPDIVESARRQGERLARLIKRLGQTVPTFISAPTLPLPPLFITPGSRIQAAECELRAIAGSLVSTVATYPRTRIISPQRLDEVSPFGQRFDPKAEISSGFPYTLEHASRLAELFATLIRDESPKKGLITDLDDTLWAGIIGEVGVEGIAWGTARGGHLHGLYQRFLDSLGAAGALLAVASKNDPGPVEKALGRSDMLLPRERLFPLEINWGPKSASVRRILQRWNIAQHDVVFVDDSPMEVDEVQSSFPDMQCIVFPKNDPIALWNLLRRLRDSFGKSAVSREDEIRLDSIRNGTTVSGTIEEAATSTDAFLRNADATLSFSFTTDSKDNRAFELINKTNQFNLNGRRLSESEWLSFLRSPRAFLVTASYEDKYGPLGKIAVVLGRRVGPTLHVDSWVMSCRAFSRRIEHHCLSYLFEKTGATEIRFDYVSTPRNAPLQSFLAELLDEPPTPNCSLHKAGFDAKVPALVHRVVESAHVDRYETVGAP